MINQKLLLEILDYNPETGMFFWKERDKSCFFSEKHSIQWNKRYAGKIAGTLKNDSGYTIISIKKKLYRAHRLAWVIMTGCEPTYQIDHINGKRSDNRFCNLRDTDRGENHKNKRLLSTNKTGHHGISLTKYGKYRAKGWSSNEQKHLGYFDCLEDAVAARKVYDASHGFHLNHGVTA